MKIINRWKRRLAVALACGATSLGFGGCLGLDIEQLLQFGAAYTVTEFVFDNDGLIDLFPDGGKFWTGWVQCDAGTWRDYSQSDKGGKSENWR